jgi:NAD(P)-dependent dehydrogenase (short-subunit alcohol dehydrogenase family)
MAVQIDLAGQRILVVGASSGVGRAVAERAARDGARVALAARRRDRLEALAEEITGRGGAALAVPCDVAEPGDCSEVVARTVAAFGGLDGLVYTAGIARPVVLRDADQREWRRILDVNLVGASLVTAAAIPHLEAREGRAVYISSYAVRQTLPGLSLYAVSKVALDRLVEAWRMEHPKVDFTRALLGNTGGTEFAAGWGAERTATVTRIWLERGLFPAPNMMSVDVAAEAITSVLALRGYVDDLAIMPRTRDVPAG